MKKKFLKWIYSGRESDFFLVNIKDVLQIFFRCHHDWEYRADKGEEEHGVNPYKRYCKICEKVEVAFAQQPKLDWKIL